MELKDSRFKLCEKSPVHACGRGGGNSKLTPKEFWFLFKGIGCVSLIVIFLIVAFVNGNKKEGNEQRNSSVKDHLSITGTPITEKQAFREKAKCFMCGKPADSNLTMDCYLCSEECKKKYVEKFKPNAQK